MLLWILSDLHLESTRGWDLPSGDARPNFDVMIVAGDLIPRMERGVAWLRERTDRPVVLVAGNHEAYGQDIDRDLEKARIAAAGSNVHVLERESIFIDGVQFLGATGWTDFNLFNDPERAMRTAGDVMNDYKYRRAQWFRGRAQGQPPDGGHLFFGTFRRIVGLFEIPMVEKRGGNPRGRRPSTCGCPTMPCFGGWSEFTTSMSNFSATRSARSSARRLPSAPARCARTAPST